jgi:cytochrome c oxidase subunit 3
LSTTSTPQVRVPNEIKPAGLHAGTTNLREEIRISAFPRTETTLPAETGVWVAVAAISMCFAALISALIVREGIAADWVHFGVPRIMYVNTFILLVSSISLEAARNSFSKAQEFERQNPAAGEKALDRARLWLLSTVALGALFVVGQVMAWRDLVAKGLFLASSPSSSFFYLLTAAHGLHLLGGIAGLGYAFWRIRRDPGSQETGVLSVAGVYWHFMDGLWAFLFIILVARM